MLLNNKLFYNIKKIIFYNERETNVEPGYYLIDETTDIAAKLCNRL
ncbi:MAG: hypothetical protein K0R15_2405 [Clostridiales bacterium]|jgi:hypothetical protein|nr:hypothetical protein [Clostridiales bacterium]